MAPLFPCLSATPFFFIIDLRPEEEEGESEGEEGDKEKPGNRKKEVRCFGNWMHVCVMSAAIRRDN